MADHFTDGYDTEPMVALTAAAMATDRLRLRPAVLGVDYRHPVLVHRMAATLDVVSEGRLTLGIGAGWMTSDYEAAGIDIDEPGVRVSRLEEAIDRREGSVRSDALQLRRRPLLDPRARRSPEARPAAPSALLRRRRQPACAATRGSRGSGRRRERGPACRRARATRRRRLHARTRQGEDRLGVRGRGARGQVARRHHAVDELLARASHA